jgi:hypothetical protein
MRRTDILAIATPIAFCEIDYRLFSFIKRNGIVRAGRNATITTSCLGERDALVWVNDCRTNPLGVLIERHQRLGGAILYAERIATTKIAVPLAKRHLGGSGVQKTIIVCYCNSIKRTGRTATVTPYACRQEPFLVLTSRRAK